MAETSSTKEAWPNDGTLHHDVSREALYANALVDTFLTSDRRTILISSKGMGKTLLLRAKKRLLERTALGYTIIPRDAEYDEPRVNGNLPATGFEDMHFWNFLWQSSIVFSILSYAGNQKAVEPAQDQLSTYIDRFEIDDEFKASLKKDIDERQRNLPSYYLGELLRKSLSASKRFARSSHIIQQLSCHYINSSYCVFIDAFDQMLERHFSQSLDTWKNAQLGLLKAIHQLNTQNAHIKVYASIRQEAFAGFVDSDREVIRGKAIMLEYSYVELEEMFLHAVQRYTEHTSLPQFFGTDVIANRYYKQDERPFKYIYRHSTGTPRSIMGFGHELSLLNLLQRNPSDAQQMIRDKVNKLSSANVVEDYLHTQRQFFLETLREDARIQILFSILPTNILRTADLKQINREFARICGISVEESHPFCELFNIGLLGTVRGDPVSGEETQFFKKPFEFEWKHGELIKRDRIYFLHPSLHGEIRNERTNYVVNRSVLIGGGAKWPSDVTINPLVFLSYSSFDKQWLESFFPLFSGQMSLALPITAWYDVESLKAGAPIVKGIEGGVHASAIVLVFISRQSLSSKWVEREWRLKYRSEIETDKIQLIAIIIDDTPAEDIPELLRDKKILRMPSTNAPEFGAHLLRLCQDLAHHLRDSAFYRVP